MISIFLLHRSKLTFWISITKWHLNYSYVTLILCSKCWCIMPIDNHACSEASKLHSWSSFQKKNTHEACTRWVNLDLYLCMLNVPGSWELICTQPEKCWIKYRNISCCSTTISISTIMIGFSAVAALIVFEKAVTSVSTILKWATSMLVSNLYLQLHIGTQ